MSTQAEALATQRGPDGRWVHTYRSIAEQSGIKVDSARRLVTKARKGLAVAAGEDPAPTWPPEPIPAEIVPAPARKSRTAYETAGEAFRAWIGAGDEPMFSPAAGVTREDRIAVFNDIHAPWHDKAALVQACDEAVAAGCTMLYVAGDLFEFHRISRHHKSKSCTFEEELAGCRVAAEYLASRFPVRRYFRGNHEDRWAKYVADNVAEELQFLIPDVVALALDGLGWEFVGHKAEFVEDSHDMVWLAQVGLDAVLTHCQLSSSQQGVNLDRLKNWLREWGSVLGFTDRPRFVLTGHTHRGTQHHEHDALLVEGGCLASFGVQNYQYKSPGGAQLCNRKPGVKGWTLLVQRDGRTDLRESGFRRLAS